MNALKEEIRLLVKRYRYGRQQVSPAQILALKYLGLYDTIIEVLEGNPLGAYPADRIIADARWYSSNLYQLMGETDISIQTLVDDILRLSAISDVDYLVLKEFAPSMIYSNSGGGNDNQADVTAHSLSRIGLARRTILLNEMEII